MAWADPNSFIPAATIRDSLMNVIALDPDTDTLKIALYDTSFVQAYDDDPFTYSATHEVTGTNWASGGVTLDSPAVTIQTATTGIKFDATDVSVASTTISTGATGRGNLRRQSVAKGGLVAVYFGGTGLYH